MEAASLGRWLEMAQRQKRGETSDYPHADMGIQMIRSIGAPAAVFWRLGCNRRHLIQTKSP